ncbi:MAG: hypothetical protein HY901_04930 [Deltaproteobacteria bacterium]|nr:hypothetical protein [Deltaproteobacteria bacterium]
MRRRGGKIGWAMGVAVLMASLSGGIGRGPGAAEPEVGFRVIVNRDVPVRSVDRRLLAEVFLKKHTRWSDGKTIRPVDLASDSPVRVRFSQEVLRRSVVAVKNYWQPIIFSGRDVPPPELPSDSAVVQYVNAHPGAIGYVSEAAEIGKAKPILVE